MVEHEDLRPLVGAALVAGDHPARDGGGHGPAAEAHVHRPARAGRGDRVARATHRDARLTVGLRLQHDRGVEGFGGEGPQRGPLGLRHLADGGEPAGDVAGVVCTVCRLQQRVQLGQALDARDRHEVAAAEAPDLALHAALLMRARDAGLAEERVEAEVRAQCGEAVALDAVASGEHPRHGRLEVVVADAPRHPAEPPEGDRMSLEERLLALAREADVDRPPRVREPHHEHRQLGQHAVEPDAHPPEVDLSFLARRMQLGDRHDRPAGLELAAHAADVGAHGRLGDAGAVVDEALPDPPRRVALLARRASGRRPATRGSSRGAHRAAAPPSRPACAAAAAPTSAPVAPCAGARGGGAPGHGWTRHPRAGLVGYAQTAPPSTLLGPSLRGSHVHPSVVTGSVGGGATFVHHSAHAGTAGLRSEATEPSGTT